MERKRKTTAARIADIESQKAQYQSKIEGYKAKISELDSKMQELRDVQKQKEWLRCRKARTRIELKKEARKTGFFFYIFLK